MIAPPRQREETKDRLPAPTIFFFFEGERNIIFSLPIAIEERSRRYLEDGQTIKIGVISDTHLSRPTEELAALMEGPFQGAEMILHAGDLTELAVLDAFSGRKVIAVCGNMDSAAVRQGVPGHRVFQAGLFTIGLIHGWGGPSGIEERIAREFKGVDCIVYGHTHQPSRREREGVFFFNPGFFGGGLGVSPGSVGLLKLGDSISAEIIYL